MSKQRRIILRVNNKVLLQQRPDGQFLLPESLPEGIECKIVGSRFELPAQSTVYEAYMCDITEDSLPVGYVLCGLREAYPQMREEEYRITGKACELIHWDTGSRFCGACGSHMELATQISKKCSNCGREVFAQVSPAIIVLVRRGEKALLVHARNFSRPFYGLVAGFVETGESLEECVCREVMEETSLKITNIKYAGSQPWPFPNSLMLGFTADYEEGELHFADGELTDGGFFTRDNLPLLPPPPSIARRLIEQWLSEKH